MEYSDATTAAEVILFFDIVMQIRLNLLYFKNMRAASAVSLEYSLPRSRFGTVWTTYYV